MLNWLRKKKDKKSSDSTLIEETTTKKKEINSLSNKEIDFYTELEIKNIVLNNLSCFGEFENNLDPFLTDAIRIVIEFDEVNNNTIREHLKFGYNRTERLFDQMVTLGVLEKTSSYGTYKVLIHDFSTIQSLHANFSKIRFYSENILSSKTDFINERVEKEKLKQLRQEIIEELREEGLIVSNNMKKREPVPQKVQDRVWNRDEGKCVKCGSSEKLEFDHIIPFSKGGSNTYRNLQLLCEKCNREKSNKIG